MSSDKGMGLLVAITLMTVVAVGIGLGAPVIFQVIASDNTTKTGDDLESLKIAVAGNPRLVIAGSRADFGFVGSMGNVPSQLGALWLKGTNPAYTFDTTKKAGGGWVGPYVPSAFVQDLLAMDYDRFGNLLIYTSTPFTRSSDGQTVAARIQSAGADATANTADDLLVDILSAEIYSTVTGTLYRGTQTVPFATVSLNMPSNGALTQLLAATDSNGLFQFNNVTFGFRSVSIDPKLTYEPNSARTRNGGLTVEFTVANYATNDVTISSLTATYNVSAWYESIRFGNQTVFSYSTNRTGSGDTVNFSTPQTVNGSGKPTQVVPIRVDKETTVTPDLFIKGVGKSVVIQLQNFKNAQTGTASNVNMSGATFTVQFSDGSLNTFTAP